MKTLTIQALDDGLKIVEGLLNTIYVLPLRVERLKQDRAILPSKNGSNRKK